METPIKKKKFIRKKRILDDKQIEKMLGDIYQEYSQQLDTKEKVIEESEKIVNLLEVEEEIEKRFESEIRLEALKYVMDDLIEGGDFSNNDINYPEIGDPNFSKKITQKKEFNQYKINNSGWTSQNLEDISSTCSFKDLTQTQKLLQNFISPNTPYRGLLVFHGVGVGKTCTSITIAEGFKEYLEEKNKKVYVLLKPSIRENFKRGIIDINKVNKGDDEQCTGDSYFEELGEKMVGKKFKSKEDLKRLERKANRIINKYYEFYGYGEFIGIFKQIEEEIKETDKKDRQFILKKKLQEKFADSIIIIDEAHNITPRDKSYTDIGLPPKKEVSDKKTKKLHNEFTKSLSLTKGEKEGKEVSGVLAKIIKMVDNLKLILLSATPMYNEAPEIVYLLNLLLNNDKKPLMNASQMFEEGKITDKGREILKIKANGYVSYLRGENPINFPYKLDPVGRDIMAPKDLPDKDMKGNDIPDFQKLKFLNLVKCPMDGVQKEVYEKYFDSESVNVHAFDTVGSQVCNIVYSPELDLKKDDIEDITKFYSDKGFKSVLKYESKKYSFQNEELLDYFKMDNLKKVSSKIAKIVENVDKSEGINFVYSQFKNSGVFPIAFALEMAGYVNYNGNTLLNLPRNYVDRKLINGKQAKYLIITGDSSDDFNRYKKESESENSDGSELKVILGTQAAGEGLSIFNVRGIHILDPWHHLNRLEQIVGRGLRNCSHKNLPLEDRNLTVFLYVLTYPRNNKETLDIKMYRKSEEKSVNVAEVQKELKKLAIDCHLNKEGNIYSGEAWERPIAIKDLFGKRRDINIGDKPFSRMCDYIEDCNYKCYGGDVREEVNTTTYSLDFSKHDIKNVIKILKGYFKDNKKTYSSLENITKFVTLKNKNLDEIIIFKALYEMIEREIEVKDIYNRSGRIIYRGDKYIFQPIELSNNIPVLERKLPFRTRKRKAIMNNEIIRGKNEFKVRMSKMESKLNKVIFIDFKNEVDEHLLKIDIQNTQDNIEIVVNEVYDRLEYKTKQTMLEYILKKLLYLNSKGKVIISFDEEKGETIIEEGVNYIIRDIEPSEEDREILELIIDVLLKSKFIFADNLLSFKISDKNTIQYFKINNDKLENVSSDERKTIILDYVNVLKKIKTQKDGSVRKHHTTFCFLKQDKNNINLKLLEKKEGINNVNNVNNKKKKPKQTQKKTGSVCGHFKIPYLNKLLDEIKDDSKTLTKKNKNIICDRISFFMRKKEKNDRKYIYFYGLDEYLELK
jgi:hypothetical protein